MSSKGNMRKTKLTIHGRFGAFTSMMFLKVLSPT